jgi:hypothetical protein
MRGMPLALARITRSARRHCWFLIFSARSPTGANCSAPLKQLVGFRFVGLALDGSSCLKPAIPPSRSASAIPRWIT